MYQWFNSLLQIPDAYANSTVTYCAAIGALIMFACVCVLMVEIISSAFVRKRFNK